MVVSLYSIHYNWYSEEWKLEIKYKFETTSFDVYVQLVISCLFKRIYRIMSIFQVHVKRFRKYQVCFYGKYTNPVTFEWPLPADESSAWWNVASLCTNRSWRINFAAERGQNLLSMLYELAGWLKRKKNYWSGTCVVPLTFIIIH